MLSAISLSKVWGCHAFQLVRHREQVIFVAGASCCACNFQLLEGYGPQKCSNRVCTSFRPRLHGNGSMWNRTRTVRIGLAFTRELMEPFHTEPLAVPELVHLESRFRTEPN